MPNWCYNTLIVKGAEVESFKQSAVSKDTTLSLRTLCPLVDRDASSAWGTKWDIEANILSEAEGEIIYAFESAWAPPVEAFIEISKKYPSLKFKLSYEESGCDFIGVASIENGISDLVEGSYYERYGSFATKPQLALNGTQVEWRFSLQGYLEPQNVMSMERGLVEEVTISGDLERLQYESNRTIEYLIENNYLDSTLDVYNDYFSAVDKYFNDIDFPKLVADMLQAVREKQLIEEHTATSASSSVLKI